jgi:uncharacterized protein (TIGR02246 family)
MLMQTMSDRRVTIRRSAGRNHGARSALRLALAGSLISGALAAQVPGDSVRRAAVRAAEQRWLAHEDNVDSLTVILGDDFLHVLPSRIVTKREQLDYMRGHPAPPAGRRRFDDLRVRVYHTAGVVNGIVAAIDPNGHERRTAFTDVLVERNGRWEAVSAQELPLVGSSSRATAASAETDGIPPALSRDVRAGNQAWIDGLEAGNATQVADSYAPDAVFCSAAGSCLTGRSAVAEHYAVTLKRLGRATSASVHSAALRVDGDLAYESGTAEARFANGQNVSGRYSTVWKREVDGHWRIFRNMSL